MDLGRSWNYDGIESSADAVVHGLGLLLALAGTILLLAVWPAPASGAVGAGQAVYCTTLLATLGVSAAYNLWPVSRFKWALRRVDHAMIFGLIAGTYTPFMVAIGRTETTWLLVGIWLAGTAGMVVKVLDLGRREWLATTLYLLLGWSGMAVVGLIVEGLPLLSLLLILAGGAVYSAGTIFHHWRGLRFQNAIWHAFVLGGAVCHFAAVASTGAGSGT